MPQGKEKREGGVTLDDLAQMVAGGFTELRQEMQEGFTRADERIDRLEAKMDQKFSEVDDRFLHLERTTSETKIMLLDMKDDLAATNAANEQNSRQIIDHEGRIAVLEAAA